MVLEHTRAYSRILERAPAYSSILERVHENSCAVAHRVCNVVVKYVWNCVTLFFAIPQHDPQSCNEATRSLVAGASDAVQLRELPLLHRGRKESESQCRTPEAK